MMSNNRGFTLLEMLVAVMVVGLTVTVFFQVLSSSMKLERKGRRLDQVQLVSGQLFDFLLARDVREDDFPWRGELAVGSWELQLLPVDVREDDSTAFSEAEVPVKLPEELYRFVLRVHYGPGGKKLLTLTQEQRFRLGYFSDSFKEEHLTPLPAATGS
ncbi:MAG: type II secretion system protein [Deltaproteobacteria bacterium]|nr:MAG: type II secretion system protein [Deltaproteobacteria bacterium]